MAAAAEEEEGGMVAVSTSAAGHEVISDEFRGKLFPANILAAGLVVYSGRVSHCSQLLDFCHAKDRGFRAKATRLAAAGAFHSPLMQV
jgi:malonyl CoA-acyl carrier protein transacylase